jgi:hypothetical protein
MATGERSMKKFVADDMVFGKKTCKAIEQAAEFFAFNRPLKKSVRIVFTRTHYTSKKTRMYGHALKVEGDFYMLGLSNTVANGLLRGRKISWITVFHELEHVAQYSRGDLYHVGKKEDTYWKGLNMEKIPYSRCEYEHEAEKIGKEYAADFMAVYFDPKMVKMRNRKKK